MVGTVFFFNDTATTEIYTLSLHDALPICRVQQTYKHSVPRFFVPEHGTMFTLALEQRNADRKSGSAGMPRPISYAVFCLKKKRPRSITTLSSICACTGNSSTAVTPSCVDS